MTLEALVISMVEESKVQWKTRDTGAIGGATEKFQDFWDYAKKNMLNEKLIKRIKSISQKIIRKIPQNNINRLKVIL